MNDDPNCGKTTDQLVFTSSCVGIHPNKVVSAEAMAQNQAIQDTLDAMNGQNILNRIGGRGLRRSKSDICDVYFWALPLTRDQIAQIKNKPGVHMVRPNHDPHMEDISGSSDAEDSNPAEIPVLSAPSSQLKKRGQIVEDPSAYEDLRSICTPSGSALLDSYFYDSNAGQGAINIAVDRGVNLLHDEFITATGDSSLLEEHIFAMDTSRLPGLEMNSGTCRTSKITGRTVGVARKAKVMFAKVSNAVSSLIDVFVQIANYLFRKVLKGETVGGYHVMSIMVQWDDTDQGITTRFEEILDLLINYFQLVVVVPSGRDVTMQNAQIDKWPAIAGSRHDIIVVGAFEVATGRTYDWSKGGPSLTVNAPGKVTCARNAVGSLIWRDRYGVDVAATQVAGVIVYWFSHDEIGPTLRRNPRIIPLRVKAYIKQTASYIRQGGDFPAIWNQFGATPT